MQTISDISIIGIDKARPPVIRKEPYIDIFFKLSHQAPIDWCKDFNNLFTQHRDTKNVNIAEQGGIYINTWVRTPEEIPPLLELLKELIKECSTEYIKRIQLNTQQGDSATIETKASIEQARLNAIIDSLDFS